MSTRFSRLDRAAIRKLAPGQKIAEHEIMAARWDQLDFANRRLFIPDAKAGEREQPITPELGELLAREREMRDDRETGFFRLHTPTVRPGIAPGRIARSAML